MRGDQDHPRWVQQISPEIIRRALTKRDDRDEEKKI